jgi:uncharacterized protein DUF3105
LRAVAKKTRTPPPPRKVQAPKVRTGSNGRAPTEDERRRKLLLYGFGASGVIALVLVIVLIMVLGGNSKSGGGSSDASIGKTMSAAGFSYSTNPIKPPPNGQVHLAKLTDKVSDWTTDPPDGGQHYYTPAPFNFYDDAVPPKIVVHNEEHGGMIIWYGPKISPATKSRLRGFWQQSPNGILATPYAPLGSKIALTAWTGDPSRYQRNGYWGDGHISVGNRFDQKAFAAFRDAFRGKGPERFPLSAMTPGQ